MKNLIVLLTLSLVIFTSCTKDEEITITNSRADQCIVDKDCLQNVKDYFGTGIMIPSHKSFDLVAGNPTNFSEEISWKFITYDLYELIKVKLDEENYVIGFCDFIEITKEDNQTETVEAIIGF